MAERPDDAVAAQSVSLLHYLEAWVRFRGDKDAFSDGITTLTWREADRLSDAIAGQFQAWGVEPGDRLGCAHTGPGRGGGAGGRCGAAAGGVGAGSGAQGADLDPG